MHNPSRKTSKHINLNLLALTFHLIFLVSTVHSQSTQRLAEPNNITELIVATLNQTILNVNVSYTTFLNLQKQLGPNIAHRYRCAFEDCLGLLDDTISNLETAISKLQTSSLGVHDVNMLLSDAMTNQDTCLEGFTPSGIHENNNDNTYKLTDSLKNSILKISSNLGDSLGMLQKIPGHKHSQEAYEVDVDEFPSWVLENDKRRLHAPVEETKFNLTVAKDGTGKFNTINAAVSAAPNSSITRFVIYIKRGVYFENVEIPKKKTMIMFVGDGIGRTVIKANRRKGILTTFQTATVGVKGEGFIAKDISFVNFAGPSPQPLPQAVALRSGSNHSAFYRCSFEGYQDTLYVHSARQFYRECDIYGTVDFVFGNAAVVFQNCSLYARKPNPGQKITYTAQGRTCPNQTTGISMINCRFLAAPDLIPVKESFKAYLGRPWKKFSRTIIMKSFIDDLVVPAGWLEWNKTFALETLHYGEYMNEGPGSNITNRVKWPGYKRINATEATQFTVGPFIDGGTWLNSTGFPFNNGL
ncbi:pectinesterase/pectinesterase inhibitor 39 [Hirschfeldia incana]|nr:pectinesterase/pectinesterase inhibitor 39 [Hirschfeldia incana]